MTTLTPLSPEEARDCLENRASWGHLQLDNRRGQFFQAVREGRITFDVLVGTARLGQADSPGNAIVPVLNQKRARMSRRDTIIWMGREQTISDWATEMGVSVDTLLCRLKSWPIEKAMSHPLKPDSRRGA